MARYITHNFFCIKCGKVVVPIMRKNGNMREKFHRKRLYCPFCKQDINCIETKNEIEEYEFRQAFLNGEFQEEAELSVEYINGELI